MVAHGGVRAPGPLGSYLDRRSSWPFKSLQQFTGRDYDGLPRHHFNDPARQVSRYPIAGPRPQPVPAH